VTESDSAPYTLEYDIQFTVRSTFLLDMPPDPQQTYGAPGLFAGTGALPTPPPQGQVALETAAQDALKASAAAQAAAKLAAQQAADAAASQTTAVQRQQSSLEGVSQVAQSFDTPTE